MPQWCDKHKMHTIDEDCPGCERESVLGLPQVIALLDWAKAERDDWSERNADRYWQMNRVVFQIEALLPSLGSSGDSNGE